MLVKRISPSTCKPPFFENPVIIKGVIGVSTAPSITL